MWCRIENEKIKQYSALPECIKNYVGFNLLDASLHRQEGFFPLIMPVFDVDIEQIGEMYFDEIEKVFKFHILSIELPTLNAAKLAKIAELKTEVRDLHQTIQWYIQMKQTDGEAIPTAVKDKIKSIRTKFEQVKAQINALTTAIDVIKFKLPYAQIATIKEQLEAIE